LRGDGSFRPDIYRVLGLWRGPRIYPPLEVVQGACAWPQAVLWYYGSLSYDSERLTCSVVAGGTPVSVGCSVAE
jgi:hypothetical protein